MKYFYGNRKAKSYFEGWYIRQQTGTHAVALIPAYHVTKDGQKSASLQVVTDEGSYQVTYPISEFYASKRRFFIKLGKNRFSEQEIRINVQSDELTMSGRLFFVGDNWNPKQSNFKPLKYHLMGICRCVPFLPCRHNILSLSHHVYGVLTINGKRYEFRNGLGYVETDHGTSFPQDYLWTQYSFKKGKSTCLVMAAIARIPMCGCSMLGCVSSIYYENKEYRLASYYGARILALSKKGFVIAQGKYLLYVTVKKQAGHPLKAPVKGGMTRTIFESVDSTIRYRFYEKGKLLFDVTGSQAGYEYAIRS